MMLIDKIHRDENKSFIVKTIGILALIVLISMLIRSLILGFNTSVSFTSFLQYLGNAPDVVPSFSITDFEIKESWGIFNFLRDFFNPFVNLMGFAAWVTLMFVRCLYFLFYLLRFFFI